MPSSRRLRGGLFGCGMISEFHLRGWLRIPEVEIVALGNRTVERARRRQEQFVPGARVYAELGEMLEREELDFIDILTLPALHRAQVLEAARAGVHIICQKPLCHTLEDSAALAGEMDGYGKVFAVHENHRYRPWFRRVREHFQAGRFGEVSLLRLEHFNATNPGETYKNESETGVLLEYGSHLVDMMRSLLGEPARVYARFHRPNPRVTGESVVHVCFEYPAATAIVDVGWKDAAATQGSMLLLGAKGEAWYEGTMTRGEKGRLRLYEGRALLEDLPVNPIDDYVESFYLLQREVCDAMLGRGTVLQTAREHLQSLIATFAAYESARSAGLVDIGAFAAGNPAQASAAPCSSQTPLSRTPLFHK